MAKRIKQEDYIGKTYNRLTIINFTVSKTLSSGGKHHIVNCQCSCGNFCAVKLNNLKSNTTKSCGCISKEMPNSKKHGLINTSEYDIWQHIKSRCLNSKIPEYKNYGGRGITICSEWLNSFENFIQDMGFRPTSAHSIERKNNNLGYFKENCRWATAKEQANNRRTTVFITFNNKTQTLSEWCDELNLNYKIIHQRLNRSNWSIEKAFNKSLTPKETTTIPVESE